MLLKKSVERDEILLGEGALETTAIRGSRAIIDLAVLFGSNWSVLGSLLVPSGVDHRRHSFASRTDVFYGYFPTQASAS